MRRNGWMSIVALMLAACGGGDGADPRADVASISVSPATVSLSRGDVMQLSATPRDAAGNVLQGRAVLWTSDADDKVSVSASGLIQARNIGNARVTAEIEGKRSSAQIVVADQAAPVSRVALNTVAETLVEGASLQLTATAYDAQDNVLTGRGVQWTSSATSVAPVDAGGLVVGLKPGVVNVTAKIEGREAAATVRVFAEYGYELMFSRADIEQFAELYALDISDAAAVPLPVFGPGKRASHATPSPDGSRIAFVVHGQWDDTFWQSMIYVAERGAATGMRLTYLPARNLEPAWSPDGSRIAFSSQPAGEVADIWVMDADGSNLVNLTNDQALASKRSPAWSPRIVDGSYRIAYALESGGTSLLWTMRADGWDKQRITSDPAFYDSEPSWSPDGSTLVFQRTGEAIFGDLYLVASTGGTGRALMPANPLPFGQFGPTWSPDGRLIAFTSKHGDGQHYEVWTVWADGTRLVQRTQDRLQHTDPSWIVRP